ncbi:hypothetical protein T552_00841 [Pneumocystis carinii B80]|uniref:Ribosomal RNA-processing protein 40 n=1 Tax=Pneumocystis carinii (strain B80) TaxID=1408658 RepID=A0A0W4ZPU7_PNEC8|nr:hypothetical protein T552_00841 [Pneumocystis carinii B80]KTW30368.1 hypothetical protein T552_00841 [Pneumocystis carinii B80]
MDKGLERVKVEEGFMFPGEEIVFKEKDKTKIQIGQGLAYFYQANKLFATQTGWLKQATKKKISIDYNRGKYIPVVGDSVIGQIMIRHGEGYKVDIGSIRQAKLGVLAFENATRKNRPNLQVGSLVYARVISVDNETEPEIECANISNEKSVYGELKGGFLIHKLSFHLCRKILEKDHPFLSTLGASIPFEIAIGSNGRIWIRSESLGITITLAQAFKKYEYLSDNEIMKVCEETIREAHKWMHHNIPNEQKNNK